MYETEDTGESGIYKYVMPGAGEHWEPPSGPEQFFLEDGGDLYAIAVQGECGKDMTKTFEDGTQFHTYWVPVLNPEAQGAEERNTVKKSAECSASFARGEGAWWSDKEDLFYFVATSGGDIGRGQVWTFDPKTDILTMMYEVRDNEIVDRPDNIAIAANGNTILVSLDVVETIEVENVASSNPTNFCLLLFHDSVKMEAVSLSAWLD